MAGEETIELAVKAADMAAALAGKETANLAAASKAAADMAVAPTGEETLELAAKAVLTGRS